MKKILIIGAGVMGSGIAMDLSLHGYNVVVKDKYQSAIDKAQARFSNDLRMVKMINRSYSGMTEADVLSRITFTLDNNMDSQADLIIECISEDWAIKEEVYKDLRESCGENTIFAVNTSCISITKVGSLLKHPENVIGVHFMNPSPLKMMVETVRGYHTSQETEQKVVDFLKSFGKNPVVVNDYPGFVANRLSHLFMNEAAYLIQDGVAEPREVDLIFKQGYGHKMGPLETADLIGLDTVMQSLEVLYESYQDSKFRCCPLLKKMVYAGLLGRKSGQGFYKY